MGLVPLPCSLASKHALWHKGAASGQPACQSAPRSEGTHCPLRRSKSGNYRSFPACLFIAITSPFLAHKEVMGYVERSCGFHHKRSKFIYLFIYLFVYFGGVGGYRMPLCLCMAIWDALLFYPLPKMLAPLHRVNPLKTPPLHPHPLLLTPHRAQSAQLCPEVSGERRGWGSAQTGLAHHHGVLAWCLVIGTDWKVVPCQAFTYMIGLGSCQLAEGLGLWR